MTTLTIIQDGVHIADIGPVISPAKGDVVHVRRESVVESLVKARLAVLGVIAPVDPVAEEPEPGAAVRSVTWDDVEGSGSNIAILNGLAPGVNPLTVTQAQLVEWLGSKNKANNIWRVIRRMKGDDA